MKRRLAGDRYELERRLGHGGMATVYCARDLKLDRQVAIKLLADNFAGDDEVRKRFSREARLAARLDHPNVVQVFDVGEDEDRPYIVMEHVEGGTLEDRLNRRRRSLDRIEALRLLGQLCEGLGHAHAKKLVHRDIKPQNLLLRESDDCLKITDFGIARAAEETTRLTRPGKVIGTDRYMAPEQLADGKITPATDVYACGVVADEMLPEARSPELRGIIERCLHQDPWQRFSDASALGEALASVEGNGSMGVVRRIKSQALPTKPLPAGGRATAQWPAPTEVKPRTRRRRTWLAGGLALVAAAAAGTVIALSSGDSSSPSDGQQRRQAPPAPVAVPQSDDPATQARELADFLRAQSRPQTSTPSGQTP
jgi:Protein kinase domain